MTDAGSYYAEGLLSTKVRKLISALLVVLSLFVSSGGAFAQEDLEALSEPGSVNFDEHLGEFIPGDIVLTDEYGQQVNMSEFIDKPTILNFVYFECPGSGRIIWNWWDVLYLKKPGVSSQVMQKISPVLPRLQDSATSELARNTLTPGALLSCLQIAKSYAIFTA